MPSPIAHTAAAYLLYRRLRRTVPAPEERRWPILSTFGTFAFVAFLSLLPDLDVIPALIHGDMERFHNGISHSLFFGVLVAPLVGGLVWLVRRQHFKAWTVTAFLCYELHVVMDYFSIGRGVMLYWPFDPERRSPPMHLFHGVRWAEGWWATEHLWMIANEMAWVALVLLAVHQRPKER